MKLNIKFYSLFFLFLSAVFYAQPPCPTCPPGNGGPGGGGVGGTTPGAATSPIDMYIFILAIAAVGIAIFYAKKYALETNK